MHRAKFPTAVGAAILLALLVHPRLFADDRDLKGTWAVVVTPNAISICNGPEIAPAPAPFHELATYAGGGVLIETNTQLNFISASLSPGFPFNASDGHGTWKRNDDDSGAKFSAKFRKFLYDATGHFIGNVDIVERISLDRDADTFSGKFTIQFTFLDNSPSLCSSGTLAAERMTVP